jgi:hypothetical protein
VFRDHAKPLVAGILVCLATFVLFYLMIVFALSWGTTALGIGREKFPADAVVRHVVFRGDDSDLRDAGGAGTAARDAVDYGGHLSVRADSGADVRGRGRAARWG